MAQRIYTSNRTDRQLEQEITEVAKIKNMLYRRAGDFVASKPTMNDEVEILGYIYRQPSTKGQDGNTIKLKKDV